MALRQRARFCGLDCLDDAPLLDDVDSWLLPLLSDVRGFGDIGHDALMGAMQTRLGWDALSMVERKAPKMFTSPAGSQHSIDYSAEAGPSVTLRVQALYGLSAHPNVGQPPIPLVLALTSPAGRVIQTTRDLPAFWAGSWHDVAKDMRGRYPKHVWPDDPANAKASLKTKNAQRRDS
jgi:ATP-dependent helicase HrpB